MEWTRIFRSHHTEWLENEILEMAIRHQAHTLWLQENHEKEIARLEALNLDAKVEALRERSDLKKAHAQELSRVIEDNQKLHDDLDRTRLFLTPALQSVSLGTEADRSSPPTPENVPTGTPWQRILNREMKKQEDEAKQRLTKPADAPVGGSDGSNSEGRVEAPLSEQSQPA